MPDFSPTVERFWGAERSDVEILRTDGAFRIVVDPALSHDRRVSMLQRAGGAVTAVLTPELADRLRLRSRGQLSPTDFRAALADAGVTLHDADRVFYFTKPALGILSAENATDGVRRLTVDDAAVFAQFEASASEQDRDDAYVELDHWAVFGAFEGERLVCAASAYPWGNARIADLGVLTLPDFRGRGHARAVVRALGRHALERGYEPQYRCQLDNAGSVALAASAGLTPFGTWEVVSPA